MQLNDSASSDDTTPGATCEVCYALPGRVDSVAVKVQPGLTILEAIEASGVLARHPIDLKRNRVGIFGKLKPLDALVRAGDRVEIYRPLVVDPNSARLRRAEKNRRDQGK